jgi:YYY domain-containing protein
MIPLADLFAAFRWWAVLFLLGAAATPLAFRLLGRLPDRGYAFVKMLGLLLATFAFWLLSSLGWLANNAGGILAAVLALVALAAWVYGQDRARIKRWLRQNRRYVLVVELTFAAIFFFWAWVRAQNPAITGTEKPMEFAFLNAVDRSAGMPPLDPWLSGFAISYYYFGSVMTSLLARLALVGEPLAFNLGLAWLAAGAAVGGFGLVYNLVAAGVSQRVRRMALILGLVAALAVPLAGNMQILLELMHANGVGSPDVWAWLDVRDVNGPPSEQGFGTDGPRFWWWWRSSRVIHEYHLSGRPEEGLEPIAEFPGFSFILGDMHPHVLALPFAFLSLAVALAWWLQPGPPLDEDRWRRRGFAGRLGLLLGQVGLPRWALTALVLGGLSFLNTWDVLIHLFVVVGAYALNQWRGAGRWQGRFLSQSVLMAGLLALPAILLYLPFYVGFRSQAGPPFLLPMLMRPTRLTHFLIIFGMPLWSVLALVVTLVLRRRPLRWRRALYSAGGLILGLSLLMGLLGWVIAASPQGSARIVELARELGLALPAAPAGAVLARLAWGASAVAALAPGVILARLGLPWLILLLSGLVGLVVMLWPTMLDGAGRDAQDQQTADAGPSPTGTDQPSLAGNLPFVLLLIFTAGLLTLGPEFVYLRDNFGQRLNTVFKFYYQAWILFGVAALYALAYLWQTARSGAILATAGYGTMLAVALLFPALAISSRAQEYAHPPTLDGIDHYRYTQPDEYAALTWLRQNVAGKPVIVEAVGGQYSPQGHGRVSATTGLPTLLGWAGHEFQWRGQTPEPNRRDAAVNLIYADANWEETADLLDRYEVTYVYVGPLEVSTYGQGVRDKFDGRLEVAFANESVIIYRWLPS